jgi:type II secretion system protein N
MNLRIPWKKPSEIDWKVWKPRLGYGVFALVAFLLALRWTFPVDAVKQRLILEASARGWQVDAADVGPGGFLGIRADAVTLDDGSGLKIPVERLDASLRLLPLLVGRRSIAFDARLFEGRVRGTADLSGAERHVDARVDGVELARILPLRRAVGVEVAGRLGGSADLKVPEAPQARSSGRIALRVQGAGAGPGQMPIPGMATGLPLPRMSLGEVVGDVRVEQGKATIDKLDAHGGDAEISTQDVFVVLQPRLDFAPVSGRATLRIADAFWARANNPGLKGITEAALAQARGRDGAWHFQIAGTLSSPQFRAAAP